MNSDTGDPATRTSATIYQFPVGGRRGLDRSLNAQSQAPMTALPEAQHAPSVSVGSAWYHDLAIQDTKRAH